MNIKEMYYFFYYKIYKMNELTNKWFPNQIFSSKFQTFVMIFALEMWASQIPFFLYDIITNTRGNSSLCVIIPSVLIFALNYYYFEYGNKLTQYILKFDNMPKSKQKDIAGIIVWTIVISILVIFFITIYLFSFVPLPNKI